MHRINVQAVWSYFSSFKKITKTYLNIQNSILSLTLNPQESLYKRDTIDSKVENWVKYFGTSEHN